MNTSLEDKRAGAGCLPVCLRFVASCFTCFPLIAGGGLQSLIVALCGNLFILTAHLTVLPH